MVARALHRIPRKGLSRDASPHAFRRTCATALACSAILPIRMAAAVLGHSVTVMVSKYAAVMDEPSTGKSVEAVLQVEAEVAEMVECVRGHRLASVVRCK